MPTPGCRDTTRSQTTGMFSLSELLSFEKINFLATLVEFLWIEDVDVKSLTLFFRTPLSRD